MYMYIYIHTHMYINIYMYVHLYIYTEIYVYVYIYIYMNTHEYAHTVCLHTHTPTIHTNIDEYARKHRSTVQCHVLIHDLVTQLSIIITHFSKHEWFSRQKICLNTDKCIAQDRASIYSRTFFKTIVAHWPIFVTHSSIYVSNILDKHWTKSCGSTVRASVRARIKISAPSLRASTAARTRCTASAPDMISVLLFYRMSNKCVMQRCVRHVLARHILVMHQTLTMHTLVY